MTAAQPSEFKNIVVLYHGGCADGFTAAWVAWRRFKDNAEYFDVFYGGAEPTPAFVKGRQVFVLDFSFKRRLLEVLEDAAAKLIVLDHHKTAKAELEGLPYCKFDMNRSGAGLTWDVFYPKQPRPWLVNYVEDRDLWRFQLPHSKAVNAWIATSAHRFGTWEKLHAASLKDVAQWGYCAMAETKRYIREMKKQARYVDFGGLGFVVPVVNAPRINGSELLNELAAENQYAVAWSQREDGRFQYEIRSARESGFDVSEIAKQFGGGGHFNAADFVVSALVPEPRKRRQLPQKP